MHPNICAATITRALGVLRPRSRRTTQAKRNNATHRWQSCEKSVKRHAKKVEAIVFSKNIPVHDRAAPRGTNLPHPCSTDIEREPPGVAPHFIHDESGG
jgi:hypothetical protein